MLGYNNCNEIYYLKGARIVRMHDNLRLIIHVAEVRNLGALRRIIRERRTKLGSSLQSISLSRPHVSRNRWGYPQRFFVFDNGE